MVIVVVVVVVVVVEVVVEGLRPGVVLRERESQRRPLLRDMCIYIYIYIYTYLYIYIYVLTYVVVSLLLGGPSVLHGRRYRWKM